MEYEKAEATVVEFETEDIIATSGNIVCSSIGCDETSGGSAKPIVSEDPPVRYD